MPDIVWKIVAWMFIIGSWYAFVLLIIDLWKLASHFIRERRLKHPYKISKEDQEKWRKYFIEEVTPPGTGTTYSD